MKYGKKCLGLKLTALNFLIVSICVMSSAFGCGVQKQYRIKPSSTHPPNFRPLRELFQNSIRKDDQSSSKQPTNLVALLDEYSNLIETALQQTSRQISANMRRWVAEAQLVNLIAIFLDLSYREYLSYEWTQWRVLVNGEAASMNVHLREKEGIEKGKHLFRFVIQLTFYNQQFIACFYRTNYSSISVMTVAPCSSYDLVANKDITPSAYLEPMNSYDISLEWMGLLKSATISSIYADSESNGMKSYSPHYLKPLSVKMCALTQNNFSRNIQINGQLSDSSWVPGRFTNLNIIIGNRQSSIPLNAEFSLQSFRSSLSMRSLWIRMLDPYSWLPDQSCWKY